MKYQCSNPECNKTFIHTAKAVNYSFPKTTGITTDYIETAVCPHCGSKNYDETTQAPVVQVQVESVYIYDLTSGPQTALDALLAQGYVIVNRYSKQYHLEKPKSAPIDANPTLKDVIKAGIEQAKQEASQ